MPVAHLVGNLCAPQEKSRSLTARRTRTRARAPCFAELTGRAPVGVDVSLELWVLDFFSRISFVRWLVRLRLRLCRCWDTAYLIRSGWSLSQVLSRNFPTRPPC